jgi:hypothetical protein
MYPQTRTTHPVREVIAQAHRELQSLVAQRTQVVQRIGALKQTIAGLADLFGEGILSDGLLELIDRKRGARQSGFTRTCRSILMEANFPLTPHNIYEEMQRLDPEMLAHHKSPIASITTVMGRLVKYGEAHVLTTPSGRRAWRWAVPPDDSVNPAVVPAPDLREPGAGNLPVP